MKELPLPYTVVHIISIPMLGHVTSPYSSDAHDCWCEPTSIFWTIGKTGIPVMVVEHNDYSPEHRREQLAAQEAGVPAELAWINHALYATAKYPTAANRDLPFPYRGPAPQGDTP
jgi:hypothetical protein